MDWIQFTIFFFGVVGLWFWSRAESRADIRHMDEKLEAIRSLVKAIEDEGRSFREAMALEMKDFHYRLLEIERNRTIKF